MLVLMIMSMLIRTFQWFLCFNLSLFYLVLMLMSLVRTKADFPLANIFARSDFFTLFLSFRLKPSGTNLVETKEKSRFARKYSLVENRLKARLYGWLITVCVVSQETIIYPNMQKGMIRHANTGELS